MPEISSLSALTVTVVLAVLATTVIRKLYNTIYGSLNKHKFI